MKTSVSSICLGPLINAVYEATSVWIIALRAPERMFKRNFGHKWKARTLCCLSRLPLIMLGLVFVYARSSGSWLEGQLFAIGFSDTNYDRTHGTRRLLPDLASLSDGIRLTRKKQDLLLFLWTAFDAIIPRKRGILRRHSNWKFASLKISPFSDYRYLFVLFTQIIHSSKLVLVFLSWNFYLIPALELRLFSIKLLSYKL